MVLQNFERLVLKQLVLWLLLHSLLHSDSDLLGMPRKNFDSKSHMLSKFCLGIPMRSLWLTNTISICVNYIEYVDMSSLCTKDFGNLLRKMCKRQKSDKYTGVPLAICNFFRVCNGKFTGFLNFHKYFFNSQKKF